MTKKLHSVKGGRVTVHRRKGQRTRRVLFLTGTPAVCLDDDGHGYLMEIIEPIEVSVPETAVQYKAVGDVV